MEIPRRPRNRSKIVDIFVVLLVVAAMLTFVFWLDDLADDCDKRGGTYVQGRCYGERK